MGIFDNLKSLFGNSNAGGLQHYPDKLAAEAKANGKDYWNFKISELPSYAEFTQLDDRQKIELLHLTIVKSHQQENQQRTDYTARHVHEELIKAVVRSKTVFTDDDIAAIINSFIKHARYGLVAYHFWPIAPFIVNIAKQREQNPMPFAPEAKAAFERLKANTNSYQYSDKEGEKLVSKIDALLFLTQNEKGAIKPVVFIGDDALSHFANPQLLALPNKEKEIWYRILAAAQKASGGKPSAKYLSEAKKMIAELGGQKFGEKVKGWFDFIVQNKDEFTNDGVILKVSAINQDAVKGLVWMASQVDDLEILQTIAALTERSFAKVPQFGSTYVSIGNACLFALYKSGKLEGIGHLSRLKLRIKLSNALKAIEKYMEEAAAEQGMTVYEIEDLAVSDFGLVDGKRTWHFDDYRAEVSISGIGKTETKWIKPDGTLQKTVPAFVKDKHDDDFKDLKNTAKQMEVTVTAQRDRVDRMLRSDRRMAWAHFEKYYVNHGLMSYLTHNLIWDFADGGTTQTVLFYNGQWQTNKGQAVKPTPQTSVSLWHPVVSSVDTIKTWRDFLTEHQIVQPLKQAFREVYLLTDAEASTKNYSNRMAAHVLKQHQFNQLAKTRGWKYSLLGAFDDGRENGTAELILNEYGLQAEYWVNEINAEEAYNDTGIWNYVATDQVRFTRLDGGETIDLIDVPVKPFSEIMRDVDLFVGVASVGNDPAWQDTGGVPAYRNYWQAYSFGDLSETAKMRKEILTNLVPRLKISKVAEIRDKFLVVQGKLRTYKIHIGSTNILMEPNDQYLCIVPDRKTKDVTENVYLPFEGDNGLSVVLSKAFLLADDDKITDPTIISQLKMR
ncbi:DUF4132 domain-containing protein [Flavobacterium caeni]|uniref:Uncharacterized protein n=1 Tax=Flavobacterium caeni TaxID=490189 RepID=A0A1G5K4L9_9FLAO|nr:DUF4132 domain-containing protein [Flavobacterium caeni]SCY95497.1 protein of unknown function [Flavobacterium caeni]